jgi:hypothetical protein
MANSFASENMWIVGTRFGWVLEPVLDSVGALTGFRPFWLFDTLASNPELKLLGGPAATSKNIDVKLGDGDIIRFKDNSGIIDGLTETEVVDSTGGSDASNYGEMTFVSAATPLNTSLTSMTAFLAAAKAAKVAANKYLVIMPCPYTALRMGQSNQRKADGFAYMIGKITNDIAIGNTSPVNLTTTFASQVYNELQSWADDDPTGIISDMAFNESDHGIAIKRGGGNMDIAKAYNIPVDLTLPEIELLATGNVVIKPNV